MLSAVILSKNNQKTILRLLESLKWVDEVLLIDDFSIDETPQIATSKGCKVYKYKLDNDFSKSRNFALKKVKGDYVLFVDSDEEVSYELSCEIQEVLKKNTNTDGYYIKREDIFLGKLLKYGETGNIKFVRLAKKNAGIWKRKVHEYWDITGSVETLKNPLIHNSANSLSLFISKLDIYSKLHAESLLEEGKKFNVMDIIIYPSGKFILNYFIKLGFLDGTEGFIHAIFMSLHSFLSRVKMWEWKEKIS